MTLGNKSEQVTKVLIVNSTKDLSIDDANKSDILLIRKNNGMFTTAKNKFDTLKNDMSIVEVEKIKKDGRYIVEER